MARDVRCVLTSSTVQITEVDPFDEDALRAWHDVCLRSQHHQRPWASPWQYAEVRAELRAPGRRRRFAGYAGVVEGQVVSSGALSLPLLDNLGTANFAVDTDPSHRRQGFGSAMLAHLESLADGNGRHLVNTDVFYPYDAPVDGSGHPHADFLTRRGYAFGLGDVARTLDLPVNDAFLEELVGEAAAHHTSYRIEAFSGPVPEKLVASFAVLSASLMTEAPVGEVEREAEAVDVAALREEETMRTAQGRTPYTAVAVDEDGQVVAFTTVMTTTHDPGRCFQWGTVVRREDRGHRLGTAVKATNLRLVQREDPSLTRLLTYNAEVNAHMVAINDRLGFRPVERLGEFQKRL